MATCKLTGLDAYQSILNDLTAESVAICKRGAYAGADVIADAVRAECPVDEGDLRDSIGLARIEDDNGFVHTKLGFAGYDRDGSPNIVKARVIESGASNHNKNPFVRRALNRVRARAQQAMADAMTEAVEKTTK